MVMLQVRKISVSMERSSADFVFHILITCGKNDMDDITPPI
jgi:hypothetical protein